MYGYCNLRMGFLESLLRLMRYCLPFGYGCRRKPEPCMWCSVTWLHYLMSAQYINFICQKFSWFSFLGLAVDLHKGAGTALYCSKCRDLSPICFLVLPHVMVKVPSHSKTKTNGKHFKKNQNKRDDLSLFCFFLHSQFHLRMFYGSGIMGSFS